MYGGKIFPMLSHSQIRYLMLECKNTHYSILPIRRYHFPKYFIYCLVNFTVKSLIENKSVF